MCWFCSLKNFPRLKFFFAKLLYTYFALSRMFSFDSEFKIGKKCKKKFHLNFVKKFCNWWFLNKVLYCSSTELLHTDTDSFYLAWIYFISILSSLCTRNLSFVPEGCFRNFVVAKNDRKIKWILIATWEIAYQILIITFRCV